MCITFTYHQVYIYYAVWDQPNAWVRVAKGGDPSPFCFVFFAKSVTFQRVFLIDVILFTKMCSLTPPFTCTMCRRYPGAGRRRELEVEHPSLSKRGVEIDSTIPNAKWKAYFAELLLTPVHIMLVHISSPS
jgi:hypothetical protein